LYQTSQFQKSVRSFLLRHSEFISESKTLKNSVTNQSQLGIANSLSSINALSCKVSKTVGIFLNRKVNLQGQKKTSQEKDNSDVFHYSQLALRKMNV
jgi:hypothetical protein